MIHIILANFTFNLNLYDIASNILYMYVCV